MERESNSRIRCQNCFSYNDPDARFCSQCAHPLDMERYNTPIQEAPEKKRTVKNKIPRLIAVAVFLAAGLWGGIALYKIVAPSGATGQDMDPLPPQEYQDANQNASGGRKAAGEDFADAGQPETDLIDRALSPNALLEMTRDSIYLFSSRDRNGELVIRCAAVETPWGLAVPYRALLGSYIAWAENNNRIAYEIERILFFDDVRGCAILELDKAGVAPVEIESGLKTSDPGNFEIGERIYQITPSAAGDSDRRTGKSRARIIPGSLGGRTYDEETGGIRYAFSGPPFPPEGSIVVDNRGRCLGLSEPSFGKAESMRETGQVSFIPSTFFDPAGSTNVLSLLDFNVLYYEGSFDDLVRKARSAFSQNRLEEALEIFDQARLKDYDRYNDLKEEVLDLILKVADLLLESKRFSEALELCGKKSGLFPLSARIPIRAFRAAVAMKAFSDARGWFNRAIQIDPTLFESLKEDHVSLYLEWSGQALLRDDRRTALGVISEGIGHRPDSAPLHETLGNLLMASRDYSGAIAAFQDAIRIDPDRYDKLISLIRRCAELNGAPGAVTLDFDPKGPIRCRGLINERAYVRFIVDTGASYSSIPASAVERLGINLRHVTSRVRISTANGESEVPYFKIDTIDVSGLTVKNTYVLVIDLPSPDSEFGLLGLDFLKHFDYTIDHRSGRMVLKQK